PARGRVAESRARRRGPPPSSSRHERGHSRRPHPALLSPVAPGFLDISTGGAPALMQLCRSCTTANISPMSVAPPASLRERRKADTWLAIHEAAATLALERGLENATVEAVAEAAGISPRTFFNYF